MYYSLYSFTIDCLLILICTKICCHFGPTNHLLNSSFRRPKSRKVKQRCTTLIYRKLCCMAKHAIISSSYNAIIGNPPTKSVVIGPF